MQSNIAPGGMVVTPHHLATQTAVSILRSGGTAVDAMIAAAATMSVVHPHMSGIGGDGFWLIVPPHGEPIVIEACGAAGSLATGDFFEGLEKIPYKGPKSAITVPGTIKGWQEAQKYMKERGYSSRPFGSLLTDAIQYAENGYPMTESLRNSLINAVKSKSINHDFAKVFLPDRKIPEVGDICYQKQLANTLRKFYYRDKFSNYDDISSAFYAGEVAKTIIEDVKALGIPITKSDLENYTPTWTAPMRFLHNCGEVYNLSAHTEGLVSLLILGILERLEIDGEQEGKFIHSTVEATKQAFEVRNEHITDPKLMEIDPQILLSYKNLSTLAKKISFEHATLGGKGIGPENAIWMGAMDNKGFSVGLIQSLYSEFGSGVLLPKTGILWHNRGMAFSLTKGHAQYVEPGKKPLHTLTLGAAKMHNGSVMIFGTRGGDGPQTEAAIFHRYAIQNMTLQAAISAPRWIYSSSVGDPENVLKLEERFDDESINYIRDRGHKIVMLPANSETVGQAGALVRHPNGMIEGAFDPRGHGSAAGF